MGRVAELQINNFQRHISWQDDAIVALVMLREKCIESSLPNITSVILRPFYLLLPARLA